MTKTKLFSPSQFKPTKWESEDQKAKFANQFVKFVDGGFQFKDFPKWFYNRLSMTFGHIAHYNQTVFFETFFDTAEGKAQFMRITRTYSIGGDPLFTYSDVELALQKWTRDR